MSYRDYGPIPSRWLKCPRKASGLVAGKFLAFKTPLGHQFNDKVPEENRFTPSMLFVYMKSLKVKLGLWVDLTNTTRFYDKTEIENMDCKYVKMQCRGHGETPSLDQTKLFIQLVTKFLSQNPLEVIGVHCTHGFNRTGFLLVCYMVEQLDCSVEAAITEFAKMRPPGIYKQDYLEELYRRYDDVEYTPAAPLRPEWCDEEEEDYDDCTPSNSQSSSSQNTSDGSTTKQINFLVDYMSEITGPFGGQGVHAEWTKLKELLATKGPNRSVEQWKNTWRDLIQKAKEEGVRARLTCNQAGSAMPLPEISEMALKILTTLGPEYVMTIGNEETGIEKISDEMVVEPYEPSPESEPQPHRRARRRTTDRPMARILASLKKQNSLLKERITERRIRNLLMMRYIKGHLRGPVHRLSFGQSLKPKKGRKETTIKKSEFMPGVRGVEPFNTQPRLLEVQQKTQEFCEWPKTGFPGSQPVSMDVMNLRKLHEKPYRVSWKADGVRYMMLIDGEGEVYMIDRDNCVFKVFGLRFVHRKDLRQHLKDTLLDGEMVIDKVQGREIPRYLCYDIIRFEGQDISKKAFFPSRMDYIEHEIINPRLKAIEKKMIHRDREPFSVRLKQFYEVRMAHQLLGEKFAKTLSHEPDGLIFQPSKEPYVPGPCEDVLKWKPSNMNSVDFRLKIVTEGGQGILPTKVGQLFVGQLDPPFATMKVTKDIKHLNNKIVECTFENNRWVFMRERTDKSYPNSYNTAKSVCESIKDPVTKERLLDFIDNHRFIDDSDLMPMPKMVRR